jgi:hypothetical protein
MKLPGSREELGIFQRSEKDARLAFLVVPAEPLAV